MIIVGQESKREITFQVDSGATVNVVSQKMIPEETEIEKVNKGLKAWNNAKITAIGECVLRVQNKKDGKKYKIKFMVIKENLTPILGKRTSEQMGLIQVRYDRICKVEESDIFNDYKDVFDGNIGTLPGKVHLTIDKTVKPVANTK